MSRIELGELVFDEEESAPTYQDAHRKRGGRPKKNTKTNKKVSVYFSDEEKSKIDEYCEENGVALSKMIRSFVLKKIKTKL